MGFFTTLFGLFSASESPCTAEYELVPASEQGKGKGFYVKRCADQKIFSTWRGLPTTMTTFCIAGISFYRHEDPVVSPGFPFRLELEPDNKHDANAVAIFDEYNIQAGHVPATIAEEIGTGLRSGRFEYCISVWRQTGTKGVVQCRVLIVDKGTSLKIPNPSRRFIENLEKKRPTYKRT